MDKCDHDIPYGAFIGAQHCKEFVDAFNNCMKELNMQTLELLAKQNFVTKLGELYKEATRGDIIGIEYHYMTGAEYDDFDRESLDYSEKVLIMYRNGQKKIVNVAADSLEGILCDVYKRLYLWD